MLLKNLQLFTKKFFIIFIFINEIYSQTTSMNFLKIPATSRHAALGGYSAFSDDIGGIFVNPAGLLRCNSMEIGMTHTKHFQDMDYKFLGLVLPKKSYTLSFGISFFQIENIEARDYKDLDLEYVNIYQTTYPTYYYSNYSLQLGMGFSKKVFKNCLFGSTFKILNENISNTNSYTLATDIGFQVPLKKVKDLNLAFALNNFGFPVKYEKQYYPLPIQIIFGSSYKFRGISFLYDIVYPIFDKEDFYIGVGSEILIFDYLYLRGGYKYKPYGWYLKDDFAALSGGVGFRFFGVKLDYSLVSFGVLGLSHRFSFILELDRIRKFYELFRKKIFTTHSSISEVKTEQTKEVLKPIRQHKVESLDSGIPFEFQEFKVSTVSVNLISVDTQNKIFIYEVKLPSKISINNELVLENLYAKISSRLQLKNKENLKIYFLDFKDSSEEVLYSKVCDFSDMLKFGSVFELDVEFSSLYSEVAFYLLDKDNKISELKKEVYEKDSVYLYKLKLPIKYKLLVKILK
ncbi:MAG: PorV/PorQ family protein [Elusimicrobiota bacterium]|nr:PorV/PorQ family protein [Endomicrobiia bacterium]MDW8165168.1 PorV/PorQ family protein [Elusimicrobiota bacterium]